MILRIVYCRWEMIHESKKEMHEEREVEEGEPLRVGEEEMMRVAREGKMVKVGREKWGMGKERNGICLVRKPKVITLRDGRNTLNSLFPLMH